MAVLGFDANPTLAVSEKYGDRLSAMIQQSGATIAQGLEQIMTKRQLQGFGDALSQMSPESPDYPQKLIGLRSQFPLAADDPRGRYLAGIGFKAYENWQGTQKALATAQARDTANPRVDTLLGGGRPPGTGIPAPAGAAPNEVSGGEVAVPPSGFSGNMGIGAGASTGQPPDAVTGVGPTLGASAEPQALPPLPDATSETLIPEAPSAVAGLRAQQQATGIKPRATELTRAQMIDSQYAQRVAEKKREEQVKAAATPELVPSEADPSLLVNSKTGAVLKKTDEGVFRPGGEFEKPRLAQTKKAQEDRIERWKNTDTAKGLEKEMKVADTDLAEARRALTRYRNDQIKNTADENLKQRVFTQEKVVTDLIAARNAKLGEYTDMVKAAVGEAEAEALPQTAIITAPNGKKYEVDHASKKVIREVQ